MSRKDPDAKREYDRQYREKNRGRLREYQREYAKKNREAVRAKNARWCAAHPERLRHYDLKRSFGLTIEQYEYLAEQQGQQCACCGRPRAQLRIDLAVDHDHATGKVRGLICDPCNRGIGLLGDTLQGLERAMIYLRQQSSQSGAPWPR